MRTTSSADLMVSENVELSEKTKIFGGFIGPSVLVVLTVLLGVVGKDGREANEALTDSNLK
jgi:hypothetical protein